MESLETAAFKEQERILFALQAANISSRCRPRIRMVSGLWTETLQYREASQEGRGIGLCKSNNLKADVSVLHSVYLTSSFIDNSVFEGSSDLSFRGMDLGRIRCRMRLNKHMN